MNIIMFEYDTDKTSKAAAKSRKKAEKALKEYLAVYLKTPKENISVTCRGLGVDVCLRDPISPVTITTKIV